MSRTSTHTPPACSDPYEPNNTGTVAWPIVPGDSYWIICSPADIDWYRSSVTGLFEITSCSTACPAAYDITPYTPSSIIGARGTDFGTSPRELTHVSLADGAYLLRIGPRSAADWSPTDSYHLRVELVELSPRTLRAIADLHVREVSPGENCGSERRVIVSMDEFENETYSLFRFNLSDVPAVPIASAYLRLALGREDSRAYDVAVWCVSCSWDEDVVTWGTKP